MVGFEDWTKLVVFVVDFIVLLFDVGRGWVESVFPII